MCPIWRILKQKSSIPEKERIERLKERINEIYETLE